MTRRANRLLLAATAAFGFLGLAAYLAFEDVARDPVPPDDAPGLVRWLAVHPADWLAASALADRALDSSLERRIDIWRAAHTIASRLSPARPNAAAAFVRSGLFHWYELDEADRHRVLEAVKPLLRDEATFRQLAVPLWILTRDFALLRQSNPGTPEALGRLRELAITNGLFGDYRALREQIRRARFEAFAANPAVNDFYMLLPRPMEAADEPYLRRILAALHAHPVEPTPNVAPLIEYALRHRLQPLDGLAAAVHSDALAPPLRARLALALGNSEAAKEIELEHAVIAAPEWSQYFLDAARFAASGGDRATAHAYLSRAGSAMADARVFDAMADISGEERYRNELASRFGRPHGWSGLCGTDVCTSASSWVRGGGQLRMTIAAVQSDEVAPYVEILVDDALAAEGPVAGAATFEVPLGEMKLHRIDVRIANPLTRNRVQRRVALSS